MTPYRSGKIFRFHWSVRPSPDRPQCGGPFPDGDLGSTQGWTPEHKRNTGASGSNFPRVRSLCSTTFRTFLSAPCVAFLSLWVAIVSSFRGTVFSDNFRRSFSSKFGEIRGGECRTNFRSKKFLRKKSNRNVSNFYVQKCSTSSLVAIVIKPFFLCHWHCCCKMLDCLSKISNVWAYPSGALNGPCFKVQPFMHTAFPDLCQGDS